MLILPFGAGILQAWVTNGLLIGLFGGNCQETNPRGRTGLMTEPISKRYFPAIVCAEYDSPIDALIGMHVPQDEAMDLVAAAWHGKEAECVLASVDGGRAVAAIRMLDGRWAGCNAFPEQASTTRSEAERLLKKIVKRGRYGLVGVCPELKMF